MKILNDIIDSLTEKSSRDETLLTVDFNLRTRGTLYSQKVPQGQHFNNVIT